MSADNPDEQPQLDPKHVALLIAMTEPLNAVLAALTDISNELREIKRSIPGMPAGRLERIERALGEISNNTDPKRR
jgi:hypothetical protein